MMDEALISSVAVGMNGGLAGDEVDFDAIVRLHRSKVFRYALASLRDRDAAETVTQDCFWKAYQARARFRGECSLDTWLMRIAVNLVRDYVRNRRLQFWKSTQSSSDDEPALETYADGQGRSPESKVLVTEQVKAVWRAAEKLPERQKTVFLLRFVEDMDLLEIVAVTGMKEGTVKSHLFRALQSVREQLGEVA